MSTALSDSSEELALMSRDINRLTQLPCRGMIQATGSYAVHHRRCSTGACGASSARQTVATLVCSPAGRHPSVLRLHQQGEKPARLESTDDFRRWRSVACGSLIDPLLSSSLVL